MGNAPGAGRPTAVVAPDTGGMVMSLLGKMKAGAEQAAVKVKAGTEQAALKARDEVEELQTKRELNRVYTELGKKALELVDRGGFSSPRARRSRRPRARAEGATRGRAARSALGYPGPRGYEAAGPRGERPPLATLQALPWTGAAGRGRARAVSSAGRAPRLHRGGRRFEPVTAHHDPRSQAEDGLVAGVRHVVGVAHARVVLRPPSPVGVASVAGPLSPAPSRVGVAGEGLRCNQNFLL